MIFYWTVINRNNIKLKVYDYNDNYDNKQYKHFLLQSLIISEALSPVVNRKEKFYSSYKVVDEV